MESNDWHEFEPVLECPECYEDHDNCECDEEFEIEGSYVADAGQLIEASSLGTPAARAFRESVSDEDVDRIMGRVNEQTAGKPMSKTEREAAEARFRAIHEECNE